VPSPWGEVDNLADGGGVLVSGNDEGAGLDLARVAGLVQEGPEVAGLILWMSWRILITDLKGSWDEAEQWLAQRGIDALLQQERHKP
jgi:hypothetical protein